MVGDKRLLHAVAKDDDQKLVHWKLTLKLNSFNMCNKVSFHRCEVTRNAHHITYTKENMYGMVFSVVYTNDHVNKHYIVYSLVPPQWRLQGGSLHWGVWTAHWWQPPAEIWLCLPVRHWTAVSSQPLPQHQLETAISPCSLSQTDQNQDAPLSWKKY